ncbi:LOW QUALITY PROTEIN: RAD52 motif-containing protein 1 [Menidia menidia]
MILIGPLRRSGSSLAAAVGPASYRKRGKFGRYRAPFGRSVSGVWFPGWRWTSWTSGSPWRATRPCWCGACSRVRARPGSMRSWSRSSGPLGPSESWSGPWSSGGAGPGLRGLWGPLSPGLVPGPQEELVQVFGAFGALYRLRLRPNAPPSPGFYAVVQFYSASRALAAQRSTDGRRLLQSPALKVSRGHMKVRLSSRAPPTVPPGPAPLLSHAHCLDLANHYLGFNGWRSDIITLKELPSQEEEEEGGGDGDGGHGGGSDGGHGAGGVRRLKLGCVVKLSFPGRGVETRGAAVLEDHFTCPGPDVQLQRRRRLQRLVKQRAEVQAFSSMLLLVMGDGRVMLELKQSSDQFVDDEIDEVLQVNEVSLAEEDEAEDEGWDLTIP